MKVIIQGSLEDNAKLVSVMKDNFPVVNRKAVVKGDNDVMTIVDVSSEVLSVSEFSHSEIDKALLLCSSSERNCADCPYLNVPGCRERLQTDGAVMLIRLFNNIEK